MKKKTKVTYSDKPVFSFKDDDRLQEIEKFIYALGRLWCKHPNERFGQLLFNHTRIGTRADIGKVFDPFFYEDKGILKDIKQELK